MVEKIQKIVEELAKKVPEDGRVQTLEQGIAVEAMHKLVKLKVRVEVSGAFEDDEEALSIISQVL